MTNRGEFKIQVQKNHYSGKYDDLARFISYFHQIDFVMKLKPESVLEIGIGNKTVSNYLKQNGVKLDTCDFDKNLEPDYVTDIRSLPFADESYDMVMACEVIEHVPWKEVDQVLAELNRISKKFILISVPHSSVNFEFIFKFPLMLRMIKKPYINWLLGIPLFFINAGFDGEHYWEMGLRNYSYKKIKLVLKKYFEIVKEVRPVLNPYHHFFLLQKK